MSLGDLPHDILKRALGRLQRQGDRLRCREVCKEWSAWPVTLPTVCVTRGRHEALAEFALAGMLEGVERICAGRVVHLKTIGWLLESARSLGAARLVLDVDSHTYRGVGAAMRAFGETGAEVDVTVCCFEQCPPVYVSELTAIPGLASLNFVHAGRGPCYLDLAPEEAAPSLKKLRWTWGCEVAVGWSKFPALEELDVGGSPGSTRDLQDGLGALPRLQTLRLCDDPEPVDSEFCDVELRHPTLKRLECTVGAFLAALDEGGWHFPGVEEIAFHGDFGEFRPCTRATRRDFRAAFPAAKRLGMWDLVRDDDTDDDSDEETVKTDALRAHLATVLESKFGLPVVSL